MKHLAGLRIGVLLEDGVNEVEYHHIRLRLREAGANVITIGTKSLEYRGEDHQRLIAGATIEDIEPSSLDSVFIPGGLAPEVLRQEPKVVNLVRHLFDRGQVCAAICHGQQVLLSAGVLRGRKAVAAWSMVDDLTFAGVADDRQARATRDGNLITARFPHDLPHFFRLVWAAFLDIEDRQPAANSGTRLSGKRVFILADDASDSTQLFYAWYRCEEEGASVEILGRQAGTEVQLGTPTWPWGEFGPRVSIKRSLRDLGTIESDDLTYDRSLSAQSLEDADALIIPGGLATWLIRGHPGLKQLIADMFNDQKPISAIGRGPKVLLSARMLQGRTVTGGPEIRDDLIEAGIRYHDQPVVVDDNLLTCRGTEDLPEWGEAWVDLLENRA